MNSELMKNIRQIEPYIPGAQPQGRVIKLNTNENPYPPSAHALKALAESSTESLRRYPDPDSRDLKQAIAQANGVKPSEVFVGNGSDEVLAFLFMTLFNSSKRVLLPDITYSFYDVWFKLFNIGRKHIPLKEDFTIDVEAFRGAASNGGVVLANPNAPTGICENISTIEKIVSANSGSFVLIDEAYWDFSGKTALGLLKEYENLVIVRTLSKSHSLAGMRIGYAIARQEVIQCIENVKNSFNSYTVDALAQTMGKASVEDIQYLRECINRVVDTREWFTAELARLGFSTLPSGTNFVFTTHKNIGAKEIFEYLSSRGIFTRFFQKPRIDNYLRISIGTREDMEALLSALGDIL